MIFTFPCMPEVKKQFPIFQANPKLVYLDSAATTQTPQVVLDAMDKYYKNYRSNIHRGLYKISVQASEAFEASRASLASFINAKPEEIIFTSGATHGLNQLAYSLSTRLTPKDNIVLTRWEHHANLVPWQQMSQRFGFELRFIDLSPLTVIPTSKEESLSHSTTDRDPSSLRSLGMTIDLISAKHLIDQNTKIVSISPTSNVLGNIIATDELVKLVQLAKLNKAITIVDAAQAVAHTPIDVKKIDCDFLVFSGHKMYGPTGIGVLYGKKEMLEKHLEPFFFGGDMVKAVSYEKAEWNDTPWKFEAGTPNIAGAIGLGAAVKFIEKIGWKKIQTHERELTKYLFEKLTNVGVETLHATSLRDQIGIIPFALPNIHPHDIAEILAEQNICVRAGFHCAEPLHHYLGLDNGTIRVSLGVYNTEEDIDRLITGIKKATRVFRIMN